MQTESPDHNKDQLVCPKEKMKAHWRTVLLALVLPTTWIQSLPRALAQSQADEIVAVDLLTVREPRSRAESRLRVIRLTTRGGTHGYGDYFDFGLNAASEAETIARLVNRYAEQNQKKNIFMTDPSMRAVGAGQTVLGQTADDFLNARPTAGLSVNAYFPREGLGPMWQGPGKPGLIIALEAALLDLTNENGAGRVRLGRVRLCPSILIDRNADGKRRLNTPEEMQQAVATLKAAGFTAVRLELAGILDDEMAARGECAPYRYPQEVLGRINSLVKAAKRAAGKEVDVVVAANRNLSTDGMTYLALHCERNDVTLLENPMALRHQREQCEARKEFNQPLGFGGDYHVIEDFVQGINKQAGTVLVPDAGRIGGVKMLERTTELAKESKLKIAPVVQGGPLSLLAVAHSLSGRDEVLWVSSPSQEQWLKADGVLKKPLRLTQGSLVMDSYEIDVTKFKVKRIAQVGARTTEK